MKKGQSTQVLEAPQEVKRFTATYSFPFRDERYPIQITFLNRIVEKAAPGFDHTLGFLEIESYGGHAEACRQFDSEVLRVHYRRKEFETWLETQIK